MKKIVLTRIFNINEFIPLFFVSIVFIGNTQTIVKSIVLGVALIFFAKKYFLKIFDINFILITAFIVFYFLVSKIDENSKTAFSYSLLIMPPMLYAGGKWLGFSAKNSNYLISCLLLIGFFFASLAIFGVINNMMSHGFEGGSRNIAITGDQFETSATVIAATLVVLVSFGGVIFSNLTLTKKIIIFSIYVFSMFLALRLGSRTLLSLGVLSVFVGILINIRKAGFAKLTLVILFFSLSIYLIYTQISSQLELFSYFQDRIDSREHGIGTAGGRVEKWVNSIYLIAANPFGWSIYSNGYSHNFWLDSARNGGWISLVLSVCIAIAYFKSLLVSLARNHDNLAFQTMAWCVTIGLLGLFMVEPILDGFTYLFGFFCCFWGLLSAKNKYSTIPLNR